MTCLGTQHKVIDRAQTLNLFISSLVRIMVSVLISRSSSQWFKLVHSAYVVFLGKTLPCVDLTASLSDQE